MMHATLPSQEISSSLPKLYNKKPTFNMKRICISHALLRPSLTFIPDNLLLFESTSIASASPSFISTACPESLQN